VSSLSGISKCAPSRCDLLPGLGLTGTCYSAPASGLATSVSFGPRQRGQHLDAANQDVSSGHSL